MDNKWHCTSTGIDAKKTMNHSINMNIKIVFFKVVYNLLYAADTSLLLGSIKIYSKLILVSFSQCLPLFCGIALQ